MLFQYIIKEQDFLDFQLFNAYKSEKISKEKKKYRILMTVGCIIAAFYFYLKQNTGLAIYSGLLAIAFALFYPKYYDWTQKKQYITFIRMNYSKRFGKIQTIEIRTDSIFHKDKAGELKIYLPEIEKIDETKNHFFLKISTGLSLIIPKDQIQNLNELSQKFKTVGLAINNETRWE